MQPTTEQWIRLLDGSFSEQDRKDLRDWLAEDEAHHRIWEDHQQLWNRYGEFSAALIQQNPARPARAWQRLQEEMPRNTQPARRIPFYFRAAAAAVALLIVFGGLWFWQQQQQYQVVAAGLMLHHTLPDGSIATLRPGSRLSYARQFNRSHRMLRLEGEAFFEVQRNENLPFVVQGDAGAVEVLGTSFLVEAGSKDSLLLTVYTGVTALSAVKTPQQRTRVEAGQSAVSTPNGVELRHFQSGRLAWRTGQLHYKGAPLAEVISDLEHWHGISISFENPQLLQCQVTIALEGGQPAPALEAIAAIFDMQLQPREPDSFLLKGGRCSR